VKPQGVSTEKDNTYGSGMFHGNLIAAGMGAGAPTGISLESIIPAMMMTMGIGMMIKTVGKQAPKQMKRAVR
jgi:hypothetical protein